MHDAVGATRSLTNMVSGEGSHLVVTYIILVQYKINVPLKIKCVFDRIRYRRRFLRYRASFCC